MKKIVLLLAIAALLCAALACASGECVVIEGDVEPEVVAGLVSPEVGETEVVLGNAVTPDGQAGSGDPALNSDFIIENGVLEEYVGSGGDVVIPDGVVAIGKEAFCECEDVTSVTLSNSVRVIMASAFEDCWDLVSVYNTSGLVEIQEYAFAGCESLTAFTIPGSVKTVEDYAFAYCYGLATIDIQNGVSRIGNDAFRDCQSLTSVVFPNSVVSIGSHAFIYSGIKSVVLPRNEGTEILDFAFSFCGLTSVTIPGNVRMVGEYNFAYSDLTSVVIEEGVDAITPEAFYECGGLAHVSIPQSVRSIAKDAFDDCPKLAIWGYQGSCAETYAKSKGIPFQAIGKEPTGVKLNKKGTVKLKMTKTLQLKASLAPKSAVSSLIWSSSSAKIAKVSKTGKVTPVKPGTATITAKTANGKTASVTVEVVPVQPTKVKITKGAKATMRAGNKLALKAKLYPTGSTSKLTWSSSDKKVATVSQKGVVKALKEGAATITVQSENGKTASIAITVKPKPIEVFKYAHGKKINAFAEKLGLQLHYGNIERFVGWNGGVYYIKEISCKDNRVKAAGYAVGDTYAEAKALKSTYINDMIITSSDFTLCGVKIGMSADQAKDAVRAYIKKNCSSDVYDFLDFEKKGNVLYAIPSGMWVMEYTLKNGKVAKMRYQYEWTNLA